MAVSSSRGQESELWDPVDFQDALSHIEIRLWFVYMLSSVAVHDIEQPYAKPQATVPCLLNISN